MPTPADPACVRCYWFATCNGNACGWQTDHKPVKNIYLRVRRKQETKPRTRKHK